MLFNENFGLKFWQSIFFPFMLTSTFCIDYKLAGNTTYQYLNPCRSHGFVGDIALTDDQINWILFSEMDHPSWLGSSWNVSAHVTNKTDIFDARNLSNHEKWISYYKSLGLPSIQVKRFMNMRFSEFGNKERKETTQRYKRGAVASSKSLWPDGLVPYEIKNIFSEHTQSIIMNAMRHWEKHTCLSFFPKRPTDQSYIIFDRDDCGCCSYLGRRALDQPQMISIGKDCAYKGIVIHEIGHAIGFWHEQSRPDRDEYVDIFYENIATNQSFNFAKANYMQVDSLNETYDFESIMHYATNTFSKNHTLLTVRPKPCCPRPFIGQRKVLSLGDIRQTNKLYSCPKCGRSLFKAFDKIKSPEREKDWNVTSELDCQWRISTRKGQPVVLTISNLVLPDSFDCSNNFLEIRDGVDRSILLSRHCQSTSFFKVSSQGSKLLIRYRNIAPTKKTGFNGRYRELCGGNTRNTSGIIETPNYPNKYPPSTECFWKITVDPGHYIVLKFYYFETEWQKGCKNDYLEIRDGIDEHARLLKRLCGYRSLRPIKSSGNEMYLKFHSNRLKSASGFSATFEQEWKPLT